MVTSIRADAEAEAARTAHLAAEALAETITAELRGRLEADVAGALAMVQGYHSEFLAGRLTRDEARRRSLDYLAARRLGTEGYFYVLDPDGRLVIHPEPDLMGADLSTEGFVRRQMSVREGTFTYEWANPGEAAPRPKMGSMTYFSPWRWIITASDYLYGTIAAANAHMVTATLDTLVRMGNAAALVSAGGGRIFASPSEAADSPLVRILAEARPGSVRIENSFGRSLRILGVQDLEPYGLRLGVVTVADDAEQLAGTLIVILVATLLASAGPVVLTSRRFARRITEPIRRVAARLDLGPSLAEHGFRGDEFGLLIRRQLKSVIRLEYERRRRQDAEQELLIAESVFRSTTEGIIVTDLSGCILRVNRAFAELTGYGPGEVHGRTPAILRSSHHDRDFYDRLWARLRDKGEWIGEIVNQRKDGALLPVLLAIGTVRDAAGAPTNYVGIFHDLSVIRETEHRLEHLSTHHPLTGLPNRTSLVDTLTVILRMNARRGTVAAVLFLDLDDFKDVNDGYGHSAGDLLLRSVAGRLADTVRGEDFVSHFGADEFVIVLSDVSSSSDIAEVVRRVLGVVGEPVQVGDRVIRPKASVGIAVYPGSGTDPETLLRNADAAMYEAKRSEPGSYRYYEEHMNREALTRLTIQDEIRRAVAEGGLEIYLQPILRAADFSLAGAEALVRWRRGEELLQPAAFLPHIENSRAMAALGRWVFGAAGTYLAAHAHRFPVNFHLAVNISAGELVDTAQMSAIIRDISASGIEASRLCVEITESAAIRDFESARRGVELLRSSGLAVYLDDFGEGYASLRYLRELGADVVKLDRSFIVGVPESTRAVSLIKAFVGMARGLDMPALAEGIETEEQAAFVREVGFELLQGYWLSPPLPADEFLASYGRGESDSGP